MMVFIKYVRDSTDGLATPLCIIIIIAGFMIGPIYHIITFTVRLLSLSSIVLLLLLSMSQFGMFGCHKTSPECLNLNVCPVIPSVVCRINS